MGRVFFVIGLGHRQFHKIIPFLLFYSLLLILIIWKASRQINIPARDVFRILKYYYLNIIYQNLPKPNQPYSIIIIKKHFLI